MNRTMSDYNGHGSVYGTLATVFLYLLTVWTIQQWAAAATIFAGVATGAFTIYKWIRLLNNDKKQQNDRVLQKDNEE